MQKWLDLDTYIKDNLKRPIHNGLKMEKATTRIPLDNGISLPRDISIAIPSSELLKEYNKESFHTLLFQFIDERKLTDPEVYRMAGIDRKLFSKIRSNEEYHPSKTTILQLSFALKLSLDETLRFLSSSGYTLSFARKDDVIIRYFLEHKIYEIDTLNEVLVDYDLKPLLS